MGRKKKRDKQIIFCYYCDRIYENERVLIQHQRAKHFKCPQCHKRISTAQGMMVHMFQVHKETIENVPAAKEGRDSFDVEIFGMDGVPKEVIEEKRIKMFGEPAKKKQKVTSSPHSQSIEPQGHEIKIPGTRNVFSIGPSSTPGVNPMMMVRMPGMPMYPGMPYPGMPQVLPPPMPVPVSAMQLRAPIGALPNQTSALPGSLAVTQVGAPMLVSAPNGMCVPPPNIPPPNIAPPPVDALVDFPKLPPPQFNTSSATKESPKEKTEKPSKTAAASKERDDENVKGSSGKRTQPAVDKLASSPKKEVPCKMIPASNEAPMENVPSLPGPTVQPRISVEKSETQRTQNTVIPSTLVRRTAGPIISGVSLPPSNVAAPAVCVSSTPAIPPPQAEPAGGTQINRISKSDTPRIPLSFPNPSGHSSHYLSLNPQQPIRQVHPIPGTRRGKSPIIPVIPFTSGQPVGKYVPKVNGSPPSIPPPQVSQAPPIAPAPAPDNTSPKKKKTTIRIYNDRNISPEEKRAMHPKYNTHLNTRIESLSESIEERLRSLK